MPQMFAQGDLLIERVDDAPCGDLTTLTHGDVLVLAEGEATGHRHVLRGPAAMFRDDGLARDVPRELYVGHVRIPGEGAELAHDEHATIWLRKGTYRVRRQRELEPKDVQLVSD
jgi:hypothetical protein